MYRSEAHRRGQNRRNRTQKIRKLSDRKIRIEAERAVATARKKETAEVCMWCLSHHRGKPCPFED